MMIWSSLGNPPVSWESEEAAPRSNDGLEVYRRVKVAAPVAISLRSKSAAYGARPGIREGKDGFELLAVA